MPAPNDADQRYRRLLEQSRDVICETDIDGRWTYLNPAWTALTGQRVADALGTSFLAMIDSRDRAAVCDQLSALYLGDVADCSQDLRFRHVNGELRWARVRSYLMRDDRGEVAGTYGNIHDITDRKLAEIARAESERLYRLLADNSNDMIVRLSLTGVRRYVSPASFNLLGYTPEEMVGEAAAGAIHPDDRAIAIATCNTLLAGAEKPMCVYRQRRKDGQYAWLEASYRLIRDEDGTPSEFVAVVRDVSSREQAELGRIKATNQLSEANRLLLMAEEMSRVGHWRVDLASGSVHWSDIVCLIHGRERGCQLSLEDAIAFYHPDDRASVQAAVDDAIAKGRHFGFRARIVLDDHSVRHIVSSGRAEIGPDGSAVGLFGVVQDVTDAHDADVALRAATSELFDSNRLLTMAETVGKLGHWRIDYRTNKMLWSDEIYRIYGLSSEVEPCAENALAFYHPDDIAAVRAAIAKARAHGTGYTMESRLLRDDGSTVHILTRAEVEFDAAGQAAALFGIVQDVSERVAAQAGLQENEARFRLLTEQASDVISLHDVTGTCLFMSPSVRHVLGYAPQDMLGQSLAALAPREDRPVIARMRNELGSRPRGEVATGRFRLPRKDGVMVWLESAARIADYQNQPRIIVVSRDVTDQVSAEQELKAARDQARDAAAAKSIFLANMSHEIRTPMNGVVGFTELMLADTLSVDQRRRAEMIAESGRAMMNLLNDILDVSKVEAGQMTVSQDDFDLGATLEACLKLVTPSLEQKGLQAQFELAEDLPIWVRGDALRLRQVVLNLLGNAAKFTEQGGVTLRVSRGGAPDIIAIAVADTGIGIAPARQQAVLEPFTQAEESTSARFGGTGLGLSISTQLAALMGGRLELDSTPGRGSTFTLAIPLPAADTPRLDPRPVGARPTQTISGKATARSRVLVADDHDVNQLLVTEMLTALGYDCDIAVNGREAVELVTRQSAEHAYAAVLMDLQMPELDGLEATRRIRALGFAPEQLPIIALTANAYSDDVTACLAAGMQGHLTKPVALQRLKTELDQWTACRSPTVPPADGPAGRRPVAERYAARRAETLQAMDRLIREGKFEDVDIAATADLLHKLAGTAGMFGEAALGDEARSIELGLRSWTAQERTLRLTQARSRLRRLAG